MDGCPSISPAMLWGDQVRVVEELSGGAFSAEAISAATRHDNIATTFLMLPILSFEISQI